MSTNVPSASYFPYWSISQPGDYFIKWIEAELLAQITDMDVIKFIRINILWRFDIPGAFISDNGTQFVGKKVKDLLEQLKIEF